MAATKAKVHRLVDGRRNAIPRPRDPPVAGWSLREELIRRAFGGDAAAWNLLVAAIPQQLPAGVGRAFRDSRIREIADMLRGMLPGTNTHELSRLLASAGASLDRGYASAGRDLPFLTSAELALVDTQICEILSWLSARRDGTRWPRWRQIFAILSH